MPSFMIILLLVLEKIFDFFSIGWCGSHLVHVTWTIYVNFRSSFPWRFHMKSALIGQAVLGKEGLQKVWADGDGLRIMGVL